MKGILSIVAIMIIGQSLYGQTNLYVPSNGAIMHILPPVEAGNHVYFLSLRSDTLLSGVAVVSYYMSSVDKRSGTLLKSVSILKDTAFNPYEEFQTLAVSYRYKNSKLNFFLVTDVDNHNNTSSNVLKYPKTISFLQLDTNLNTVVAQKPLVGFTQPSRYTFKDVDHCRESSNGLVFCYAVRDTFITDGLITKANAEKVLAVDDTGKLLSDQFLAYEPQALGPIFQDHDVIDGIQAVPGGNWSAMVDFKDSFLAGKMYTLLMLDSNFHISDTFSHPGDIEYGPMPGKSRAQLTTYRVNLFYLPTGSLIRSSLGFFVDSADNMWYGYYAIGKGDAATRYVPDQIYFPPKSDSIDHSHNSNYGISGATYSRYDNSIYAFTSTGSDAPNFRYCVDGFPNAGQIVCIDTNLHQRWFKCLRPKAGYCIQSLSVVPPDGRKGILITGRAFRISDPNNASYWEPFIYYVDSSTRLGINDPRSPITISDHFAIYPNPASTTLTIDNMVGDRFDYSITNALGQVVASGNSADTKTLLSVASYASGVYMLRLRTAGGYGADLKFIRQ
jgi:hypothetical protein